MEILSSIARHNSRALARAVNGFVAAAPAKRLELFFFFFFFFFSPAPASESLLFFFFFIFGGGAVGGGASGSPASGGGGPAGARMVQCCLAFGEIRDIAAAGSHRLRRFKAPCGFGCKSFASVLPPLATRQVAT